MIDAINLDIKAFLITDYVGIFEFTSSLDSSPAVMTH